MFNKLKSTHHQVLSYYTNSTTIINSITSQSIYRPYYSYSSTSPIIYVTNSNKYNRLKELLVLTGDTEDSVIQQLEEDYAQVSLLFPNINSILIPKKVAYNLSKYVPKGLLRAIDENLSIAVEKCLVFLSNLSSTYYSDNKWKSLHSSILHEQTKNGNDNTYLYKKIIKTLTHGTKKDGPIIEVLKNEEGIETYEKGVSTKLYRLTNTYLKAGLTEYIIKDEDIIQNRNKNFYKALHKAMNNNIANNLIQLYPQITLPTKEEILVEAKRLIKLNYKTKKNKLLTMRNGHKNDYWKDPKQRSFVEDNIELYDFLVGRGFMIPIIGSDKSGGRVVDSFNLMPSWIRKLVKINNQPIVECDYSAFHPNIIQNIYGGNHSSIAHKQIADFCNINLLEAKIAHLSYFNLPYHPNKKEAKKGAMIHSPIHNYYKVNQPIMLEGIKQDKFENGYKSTTRKMFKMEVDIMTQVIKQLNNIGINLMYVYDALYCQDNVKQIVIDTMNSVVHQMGVKTCVG